MFGFFFGAPVWGTLGFFLALFIIGATRNDPKINCKKDKSNNLE